MNTKAIFKKAIKSTGRERVIKCANIANVYVGKERGYEQTERAIRMFIAEYGIVLDQDKQSVLRTIINVCSKNKDLTIIEAFKMFGIQYKYLDRDKNGWAVIVVHPNTRIINKSLKDDLSW